MLQTRWTPVTFGRPYTSCRPVCAPQNTQTAAEVHSLVAVETDEHEIARIKMQCAAVKQGTAKFAPPPVKLVKRMARWVVLAAEPGPSGWRHADIAAIGRLDRGPAALREWIGTWTRAMVPHCTAKLWTAATIAPLDCVPRNQSQGSKCRSRAHESFAQLRWWRRLRSWPGAV